MTDLPYDIRKLQEPMLRKRLYVVFSTPAKSMEEMVPILPDHLDYMIGLEKSGVLFASGPFVTENGSQSGRGMMILRAESRDDAEALAREDPLHKAGLRTFEVEAWQLMEGSFSVRVNYSNGTYSVE